MKNSLLVSDTLSLPVDIITESNGILGKKGSGKTSAGVHALGEFDPLPNGQALIEHWMRNLGRAERTILRVLIDAHPCPLTNDEISEATGYSTTSSSFANALGRLRSLELAAGGRDANYAADVLGEAARS